MRDTWLVLRDETLQDKKTLAVQEDTNPGRSMLIQYRKQLLRGGELSTDANLRIIREQKPKLEVFQKMMANFTLVNAGGKLVLRSSQPEIRRVLPKEEDNKGLTSMMLSTAIEAIDYLLDTISFREEEQEVVLSEALVTLKDLKELQCC